jgi:hypothetical protein
MLPEDIFATSCLSVFVPPKALEDFPWAILPFDFLIESQHPGRFLPFAFYGCPESLG